MVRKVKSHMELSLMRDVKSREFGSLKCISSRKEISFLKKIRRPAAEWGRHTEDGKG